MSSTRSREMVMLLKVQCLVVDWTLVTSEVKRCLSEASLHDTPPLVCCLSRLATAIGSTYSYRLEAFDPHAHQANG